MLLPPPLPGRPAPPFRRASVRGRSTPAPLPTGHAYETPPATDQRGGSGAGIVQPAWTPLPAGRLPSKIRSARHAVRHWREALRAELAQGHVKARGRAAARRSARRPVQDGRRRLDSTAVATIATPIIAEFRTSERKADPESPHGLPGDSPPRPPGSGGASRPWLLARKGRQPADQVGNATTARDIRSQRFAGALLGQ